MIITTDVVSHLDILTNLICTAALRGRYYFHPYFTTEEMEAQEA